MNTKMRGFFAKIYKSNIQKSKYENVRSEFYRLILDEETRETCLIQQLRIVKNIKDYLMIQKNLKSQTQLLSEIFP